MLAAQTNDVFAWLLMLGFVAVAIPIAFVMQSWRRRRIAEMLGLWASEQGVRLLDYHREWALFRPFFFHGKSQTVLRILVEFPDGRTASGWALCGSRFWGTFENQVVVRWDKEKNEPHGFPVIMREQKDKTRGQR